MLSRQYYVTATIRLSFYHYVCMCAKSASGCGAVTQKQTQAAPLALLISKSSIKPIRSQTYDLPWNRPNALMLSSTNSVMFSHPAHRSVIYG